MKVLGVDYGEKKVGLAVLDTASKLSVPLCVVRYSKESELVEKLRDIIKEEGVRKIVMGISGGKMAQKIINFAGKIKKEINCDVDFQDEALSTQKAQELSIESQMRRKKRREMEDAYSAALILDEYIEKTPD
jgi:putative Holliday junction resolvase